MSKINSSDPVRDKIMKEGEEADSTSECPYAKRSTFRIYWMAGYHSGPTGTPYENLKDSQSW